MNIDRKSCLSTDCPAAARPLPTGTETGAPGSARDDRDQRRARRTLVFALRFKRGLSLRRIVTVLNELEPPITASAETVRKDVSWLARRARRKLVAGGMDLHAEIDIALARFDHLY